MSSLYEHVSFFEQANKWRANFSNKGKFSLGGLGPLLNTPLRLTELEAAKDAARRVIRSEPTSLTKAVLEGFLKLRVIYVAEGEHALGNNQTLTAEDKAALAGKSLEQVWREIKATGGGAFSRGKSRFRGVNLYTAKTKWRARVSCAGKQSRVGDWLTEQEAARAYDAAARRIHGSAALLNFPDEEDTPEAAAAAERVVAKLRALGWRPPQEGGAAPNHQALRPGAAIAAEEQQQQQQQDGSSDAAHPNSSSIGFDIPDWWPDGDDSDPDWYSDVDDSDDADWEEWQDTQQQQQQEPGLRQQQQQQRPKQLVKVDSLFFDPCKHSSSDLALAASQAMRLAEEVAGACQGVADAAALINSADGYELVRNFCLSRMPNSSSSSSSSSTDDDLQFLLEQQPPEEQQHQQAVWEQEQQQFEQRQRQQQQQMQQSLFTMVEVGRYEVMFLNQAVASRVLDVLQSWGSGDEEEHERAAAGE
ncbi:hypothetical protein OEZ86_009336 [Tetradesmus obliquus]|nr:hypothetical protein OEZ86_009336 [Tetradesmus obliquus]